MAEEWKQQIPKTHSDSGTMAQQDQGYYPQQQQQKSGFETSGLPSMGSYGPMYPSWNKEMMALLTELEIPEDIIRDNPRLKRMFMFTKRILIHFGFTNITGTDHKRIRMALEDILMLSGQEGSEDLCEERMLMLISDIMLYKSRSDKPDGLRERPMWVMAILKNILGEEKVQRPTEKKGWSLPFGLSR
jgi:hypothetical protein